MTQDIDPSISMADGLVPRPTHDGATTIMKPRGRNHGSITSSCSSDDESAVPASRPTSGERRSITASNLNLAAGRRKLEEFKRKKALALAKKTQTALSEEKKFEYSEAKLSEAREEIQSLRAELRAATSVDDRLADDRAAMEREKAALLGEVVGLRSTVSSLEEQLDRAKAAAAAAAATEMPAMEAAPAGVDAGSHAAAIELLRDEISTMTSRAECLEQALVDSQKALDVLAEEKAGLEEQVQELTVKLAVPSRTLAAETPALATGEDQCQDSGLEERESEINMLRAELETARASLGAATERCEELEEQVQESRDNIDSLRELLAEGEAERVELVSSIESLRMSHGQLVGELNGQLEAAQMDVSQWKHRAEKAETAASSRPTSIDLAFNPQSSSPGEAALRVRLAKAEAAVEAERQAYFSLEEKSRHWQEAMEENSALKQCVTELRENERALQQYIESMERRETPADIPPVDTNQQQEARIQAMQVELDESSHTITRLSGEVNELVARLKEMEAEKRSAPLASSNTAAGFDHVSIHGPVDPHAGISVPHAFSQQDSPHHQGQMAAPMPFAAPPAFPPPPSFPRQEPAPAEDAASLFDLIDQGPPVPVDSHLPTAPPPTEPPPLPMEAPLAPAPTAFSAPVPHHLSPMAPNHAHQEPEHPAHSQPPVGPPQQPQPPMAPTAPTAPTPQPTNLMPWSLPGDGPGPVQSPTSAQPPPPEKKPVGFWGWIAGADRVIEQE